MFIDPKPILIRVHIDGRIEMQSKKPKLSTGEKIMKSILEKYAKEFPPVPAGSYKFIVKTRKFGRGTDMTLEPI